MRVTGALIKVLSALLEAGAGETYGLDLLRTTGLKSGTVYPLLDRLEGLGWVASHWEDLDPVAEGRPRRRLYVLTGTGSHEARQLLLEHSVGVATWAR